MKNWPIVVLLLMVVGCSDEVTPTDPGNFSEFYLVNNTSYDLNVSAPPVVESGVLPVGGELKLGVLDGWNEGFPVPSDFLDYLEVRYSDDFLYSQNPIVDTDWEPRRGSYRVMIFRFIVKEDLF